MKRTTLTLALTVAVLMIGAVAMASHAEVVSGDTSAGYNQPGWLFNRDTTTSTPFAFDGDEASIGVGSLHVFPISGDPADRKDKMIAELFPGFPEASTTSLAYDFLIGSGGDDSDAHQFYLNVYTNLPTSDRRQSGRDDGARVRAVPLANVRL